MSEHAPLPPSSAHLWVNCPGWLKMQQQVEPLPEDVTKTEEGIAAHWAVSEVLQGRQIDVGQIAPNGVVLTEEMCEGADLMDDAVGPERSSLMVEKRVAGIARDNWGTPDAYRLHDYWLDVWDYKFGHRHVPAFENWQLLNYATGLLGTLTGLQDQRVKVRLTVVQPRDYHPSGPVRSWCFTASDMRGYTNRLESAAEANRLGGDCRPHRHCGDCAAQYACPALQAAALDRAEQVYEPVPVVLPAPSLARQLATLDMAATLIKARRDGLEALAMELIRRGERVPGWSLKQGMGREKWRSVPEAVALGQMMGIDISKPGAITPKQAIKAGLPVELVSAYTETPVGEMKLVRDDGTAARIAFKQEA